MSHEWSIILMTSCLSFCLAKSSSYTQVGTSRRLACRHTAAARATRRTLYGPSLSRISELTSRKRFSSVMCLKWYLHERRGLTLATR